MNEEIERQRIKRELAVKTAKKLEIKQKMKSMHYKKQTKRRIDKAAGLEVPPEVVDRSSQPGQIGMALLRWSKYARIALERVGIFLDAAPPPPPPKKIEVTFD